ncbi:MAG: HD domain-containing protein [candidate division WWE3 bacterium]|nr:HD domain-containing protein [candidate division WWE3 bacterium]
MAEIESLLIKVKSYNPQADLKLICRAYEFAQAAHLGQKRLSGEDWVVHLLATVEILTEVKADSATLATAFLHDVLEETNLTKEGLEEEFGAEVASLVEGVSVVKTTSGRLISSKNQDWENLRHLILASIEDPRVLLIRLANKIHNLQTSQVLPEWQRRTSAQRVFDLWSPLAEVLGVYRFKAQMEDLAFSILKPKDYRQLVAKIQKENPKMVKAVTRAKAKIAWVLEQEGIKAQIFSRTKHLYGIYRKLPLYKQRAGGQLYDALGLRVVVSNPEHCYHVLDLVRHLWKEVPELFDDYIAYPKPNGYQSLHTVFKVGGQLVEVQIRTAEMHEIAEYGSASHYLFKFKEKRSPRKTSFVRELLSWEKGRKLNLFPDQVFVFTPKGDVKVLPKGATPVDFAFAVHTQIGNECAGAKVNGKAVSLDYPLNTGEVVEIMIAKGKRPSADWLRFVKTEPARSEIEKVVRGA